MRHTLSAKMPGFKAQYAGNGWPLPSAATQKLGIFATTLWAGVIFPNAALALVYVEQLHFTRFALH